jgi:hypothetical protein
LPSASFTAIRKAEQRVRKLNTNRPRFLPPCLPADVLGDGVDWSPLPDDTAPDSGEEGRGGPMTRPKAGRATSKSSEAD